MASSINNNEVNELQDNLDAIRNAEVSIGQAQNLWDEMTPDQRAQLEAMALADGSIPTTDYDGYSQAEEAAQAAMYADAHQEVRYSSNEGEYDVPGSIRRMGKPWLNDFYRDAKVLVNAVDNEYSQEGVAEVAVSMFNKLVGNLPEGTQFKVQHMLYQATLSALRSANGPYTPTIEDAVYRAGVENNVSEYQMNDVETKLRWATDEVDMAGRGINTTAYWLSSIMGYAAQYNVSDARSMLRAVASVQTAQRALKSASIALSQVKYRTVKPHTK